jgi:hypothetical protein
LSPGNHPACSTPKTYLLYTIESSSPAIFSLPQSITSLLGSANSFWNTILAMKPSDTNQSRPNEISRDILRLIPLEIFLMVLERLDGGDINVLMSVNKDYMRAIAPIRLGQIRFNSWRRTRIEYIYSELIPLREFPTVFYILEYERDSWLTPDGLGELLLSAIELGPIGLVKQLLRLGARIDEIDPHTPLLLALAHMDQRYFEVLKFVAALPGVELNARDCWGQNALHIAVQCGWMKGSEWLLLLGSEMNEAEGWHLDNPWWWLERWEHPGGAQHEHERFHRTLDEVYGFREMWKAVLRIRYLWMIGEPFDPIAIFEEECYDPYFPEEWASRYPKTGNPNPVVNAHDLRHSLEKENRKFVHPQDIESNVEADCDMLDSILFGYTEEEWFFKKWPEGVSQNPFNKSIDESKIVYSPPVPFVSATGISGWESD